MARGGILSSSARPHTPLRANSGAGGGSLPLASGNLLLPWWLQPLFADSGQDPSPLCVALKPMSAVTPRGVAAPAEPGSPVKAHVQRLHPPASTPPPLPQLCMPTQRPRQQGRHAPTPPPPCPAWRVGASRLLARRTPARSFPRMSPRPCPSTADTFPTVKRPGLATDRARGSGEEGGPGESLDFLELFPG